MTELCLSKAMLERQSGPQKREQKPSGIPTWPSVVVKWKNVFYFSATGPGSPQLMMESSDKLSEKGRLLRWQLNR